VGGYANGLKSVSRLRTKNEGGKREKLRTIQAKNVTASAHTSCGTVGLGIKERRALGSVPKTPGASSTGAAIRGKRIERQEAGGQGRPGGDSKQWANERNPHLGRSREQQSAEAQLRKTKGIRGLEEAAREK